MLFANPSPDGRGCREAAGEGYHNGNTSENISKNYLRYPSPGPLTRATLSRRERDLSKNVSVDDSKILISCPQVTSPAAKIRSLRVAFRKIMMLVTGTMVSVQTARFSEGVSRRRPFSFCREVERHDTEIKEGSFQIRKTGEGGARDPATDRPKSTVRE